MKIPVFVVTGFLDSGKTSFLKEILFDEGFSEDDKTLLVFCEEGEEEFDDALLKELNMKAVYVNSQDEFTPEFLEKCAKDYEPECIFLEYNGMWKVEDLLNMRLPKNWFINQIVTTVDGSTFENYINNMRSLIMDIVSRTEMILFNRCQMDMPLAMYRRSVRAVNANAQIIFEDEQGKMLQLGREEMPFDVNADVIEIDDEDFGLWYIDVMENQDRYDGKTVSFKGRIYKNEDFPEEYFVPGRHAMTCCADDIRFIGFVCKTKHGDQLKHNRWVQITATVKYEYFPAYQGVGPVLYLKRAVSATKPVTELVYFN